MAEGKIYSAIIEVMKHVGAISKDAKNQSQGYQYRSLEQVYNRVQPLMAEYGIFSAPKVLEERRETGQTKSGGVMHWTVLKVSYVFYAEDGSNIECVVVAEGMDSGDKSANKALSVAHRYALCQLFNIPYEMEDPERDSPEWTPKGPDKVPEPISMTELNSLKKNWAAVNADILKGKTKEELSLAFIDFVRETTGEQFDIKDFRQWRREEFDKCMASIGGVI